VSSETPFSRSTPETQGVASSALLAFVEAVEREIQHLHGFVLLRRGAVIAEGYWDPYRADEPHMLFSLSKSFTSTAIGMLVAEGKLSLDDPVLRFFPDEAPPSPGENLRRMRVEHLLTMTTGHDADPTRTLREIGPHWRRGFLALPVEHEPGTHFVYNSLATYMLSAIVQTLTGQRLVELLGPRLFRPLGIEDPVWDRSPEGIDAGGWGLNARTSDIARFGQLYLQRGVWRGERLVPAAWVDAATSYRVPNASSGSPNPDWQQGYGYQFWRCRHGAYRGDGAFGQFCVVVPEQEAVLAVTGGTANLQSVLDLVWEHLLPAMAPGVLAEHDAAARALEARLAGLRLPPVAGRRMSPRAVEVAGREYGLAENEDGISSVAFDFGPEGTGLTIGRAEGRQRVALGHGRWLRSELDLENGYRRQLGTGEPSSDPVAASGAWTDDDTYVAELWWCRTPFRRTLTCRFDGDGLRIDQQMNVSFGATERPRLEGRATAVPEGGRR
jgi:CubicO group peptidase (beta-lactamase class C family)